MATARTASDRVFGYRGFEAVVRSSSAAMLDWFEEFLRPWFAVGPAPAHTRVPIIDARVDSELFRRWMRAARPTGRDVVCFTMDHAEASACLLASGLFAGGRSATFVSGIPPPERNTFETALRELAGSIPCLACVIGPDAYAPASVWEEIREFPG